MSSTTVSTFVAVGLLGALCGACSSEPAPQNPYQTPTGGSTGTSGSTSTTGGNTSGGATTGGTGTGGATGGSGGALPGGSGGVSGGSGGSGGASGSGGSGGGGDLTAVRPTTGCNMPAPGDLQPGNFSGRTIQTSGSKTNSSGNPGCLPGGQATFDWNFERDYAVRLPPGYDPAVVYPVVLQGPGCGGGATSVYGLDLADQVIKVGFAPTGENCHQCCQNCFDDKEGDDTIEHPFYEGVMTLLATELCFDVNRVFISGNSSGGWWSNELGCVYAGHPTFPIRAIGVNTGGLPTDPAHRPTCSTNPMSGMWIHSTGDQTNPWDGNLEAIRRAMEVNGCPGGTWDGAEKADYPIPGVADGTCQSVVGCPASHPLVACPLDLGNDHGGHDNIANPGFSQFFASFFAP